MHSPAIVYLTEGRAALGYAQGVVAGLGGVVRLRPTAANAVDGRGGEKMAFCGQRLQVARLLPLPGIV